MDLGRSSVSFLIVVSLLILTVVGYAGWRLLRPNPVAKSDRIARQFATEARKVVSAYRRSLMVMSDKLGESSTEVARSRQIIAERKTAALSSLQQLADAAQTKLDMMEGISLSTLRNRLDRIRNRYEEAKTMIEEETARVEQETGAKPAVPSPLPTATS